MNDALLVSTVSSKGDACKNHWCAGPIKPRQAIEPAGKGTYRMDSTTVLRDQSTRSQISVWMQAVRVRSLIISSVSVFVGGALAYNYGHFDLLRLFLAWLCAVAVQSGTNLTNVHYNYKTRGRGAALDHIDPRGSTVVVEQGLLTSAKVWTGALVAFALGVASGLILISMTSWWLLLVGLAGTIAGYSYAGPPLRLSYFGMGVPTVFIFMGPAMVSGTFYAMAGSVSWGALAASISVGLMAANILHINDIRDLETDVSHHKHTITTLVGRRGAVALLVSSEIVAYVVITSAALAGVLPWAVLFTLVTLLRAIPLARTVSAETTQDGLHIAWVLGVRLHMEFGVVLILSLIAARALNL